MTPIKASPAAQASWEASLSHAERELAHINRLFDTDAFESYFRRRVRERRATHVTALESDLLTGRETRKLRARIAEIDEILAMPEQDRGNHAATLQRSRARTQLSP